MGSRREAKDAMFAALSSAARALSSGRRAEIVELLAQGPRTVEQVAEAVEQSVANTSHHLRSLARAGLVRGTRHGTYVTYELASPRVYDLWAALRDVAADHAGDVAALAEQYLGDRDGVEVVTLEQLPALLEQDAVVIDVRPALEFDAGHIPGAASVPIDRLDELLDSIPADRPIIAYCRGPYCSFADDAVRRLSAKGRRAMRLAEGYPEWARRESA